MLPFPLSSKLSLAIVLAVIPVVEEIPKRNQVAQEHCRKYSSRLR